MNCITLVLWNLVVLWLLSIAVGQKVTTDQLGQFGFRGKRTLLTKRFGGTTDVDKLVTFLNQGICLRQEHSPGNNQCPAGTINQGKMFGCALLCCRNDFSVVAGSPLAGIASQIKGGVCHREEHGDKCTPPYKDMGKMDGNGRLCCWTGFAVPANPPAGLSAVVAQLNNGICMRASSCSASYHDGGKMYHRDPLCCFVGFHASPAPPPAGTCLGGLWPEFTTQADLHADQSWSEYFIRVYGELPTSGYPLCVGTAFWTFYDNILPTNVGRGPPAIVDKCPTQPSGAGQRYRENSIYMDKTRTMSWSWHPYPYKAFSADCWVEVEHEADPFGDEHYGMWLMQAAGSGMWFNTGSTLAFAEHSDAMAHFGVTQGNQNEQMCKAASAAGLDSLQFTAHVDPVQYGDCDTKHTGVKGLKYMNMEVVAVKAVGTYACGSAVGAPSVVRAGWLGSKPCVCDNSKGFLNCAGVVTMEEDLRAGVVLV